jgi:hypothetical protein
LPNAAYFLRLNLRRQMVLAGESQEGADCRYSR